MTEQMVGADCSNSAEDSKERFADPESFVTRIDELLAARELAVNDKLRMADGRYLPRDYIPAFDQGGLPGLSLGVPYATEKVEPRRRL